MRIGKQSDCTRFLIYSSVDECRLYKVFESKFWIRSSFLFSLKYLQIGVIHNRRPDFRDVKEFKNSTLNGQIRTKVYTGERQKFKLFSDVLFKWSRVHFNAISTHFSKFPSPQISFELETNKIWIKSIWVYDKKAYCNNHTLIYIVAHILTTTKQNVY